MTYIEFCDADQASTFRLNDDLTLPAPRLSAEAEFEGCADASFEGSADASFEGFHPSVALPMSNRRVRAAYRAGRKLISNMRRTFLARSRVHKAHKPANARKAAHARARRSSTAHGGARKAADDGGGGDSSSGGDEPPPRARLNSLAPFLALTLATYDDIAEARL
jgi:hypothetical protein